MLYLVGTPIGNLKDLSPRARETMEKVSLFIAESPGDSLRLLSALGMRKKIFKYNDRNKKSVQKKLLKILSGEDGVYVTSAGMPGISDPGSNLVSACRQEGIGVTVIPGPSALSCVITLSGIRAREFTFIGFLPKKKGPLIKLYAKHREAREVIVFFESPFRIIKALAALGEADPFCRVFVAREITKLFESCYEGTPQEVQKELLAGPHNLKGEFSVMADFSYD